MTDETTDPQAVTSGTVDDLKAHLDTVEALEQLEALRKAEEEGKGRTTALAAIDAKADALNGNTTDSDENVTKAGGDTSQDATHDEGGEPATTLAEVPHPEALSDGDIRDISGGDADGPQSDVVEALEQARDEANGEDIERPYLHGMGPGVDIG